jgi:uncharacterized integral membrane protein
VASQQPRTTPPSKAKPVDAPASPSPWTAKRIVLLVLIGSGIVLALFNLDDTPISFVFFSTNAPLFLVIVLALAIGFLIGFISRDLRARRGSKPKK